MTDVLDPLRFRKRRQKDTALRKRIEAAVDRLVAALDDLDAPAEDLDDDELGEDDDPAEEDDPLEGWRRSGTKPGEPEQHQRWHASHLGRRRSPRP